MIVAATTRADPSAKTPAFGVPTPFTSPTAYTPGNFVSSVGLWTGTQSYGCAASPDSTTTCGTRCTGTPRNSAYGSSVPSLRTATLRDGSSDFTRLSFTNR